MRGVGVGACQSWFELSYFTGLVWCGYGLVVISCALIAGLGLFVVLMGFSVVVMLLVVCCLLLVLVGWWFVAGCGFGICGGLAARCCCCLHSFVIVLVLFSGCFSCGSLGLFGVGLQFGFCFVADFWLGGCV